MSDLERALDACLDALREGRWTLDDCLAQYPAHADELRPQLLAALAVQKRLEASQPPPEFVSAARERFLVASGKRLEDAYDHEPSPSFFAAARVRFLMAAHAMRRDGKLAPQPSHRRRLMPGARALMGAAAALTIFFGFSTYTVATASAALPGDWQYPVKLETERVRLALAFSTTDKREVRIDIAAERTSEIRELTRRGDRISAGELRRLRHSTSSLAQDARGGNWDPQTLKKLQDVSADSTIALQQAAPNVEPDAKSELRAAVSTTRDAQLTATAEITTKSPGVIVPTVLQQPSPTATATAGAESSPSPAATGTTGAAAPGDATPTAVPPTSEATPTARPTPPSIIVSQSPVVTDLDVIWVRVVVGRFSALVPSEKDGWHQSPTDFNAPVPSLLHFSNVDGTSLITLNAQNGDMWWYKFSNGAFQQVDMRRAQPDGSVLVIDPDVLRGVFGKDAELPLYVLNSITLEPAPTPTPSATPAQ
jgi:hypothetical protein